MLHALCHAKKSAVGGRDLAATVTPSRMRLVAATPPDSKQEGEVETLFLSPAHLEFLGQLSRELNPAMPVAFGAPHVVRTLLEQLEEAQDRKSKARD